MIPHLKIAARNMMRNTRRSIMTISAIAVGAAAMLCFGQFVAETVLEFQTGVVRNSGHLAVFRKGYYDFGGGNPAAYGLDDYRTVIALVKDDRILGPMASVVTPRIDLNGVAGNFSANASKTFFGVGVVPDDFTAMRRWDAYGLYHDFPPLVTGLDARDPTVGVVGVGVARVLGVCAPLKIANCPSPPQLQSAAQADGAAPSIDLGQLASRDLVSAAPSQEGVKIDLLTATASGAPNVATLFVRSAESQGIRELDDNYVRLHFDLAQQLLYGRGEPKAVSVVIQLRKTADLATARQQLEKIISERGLDLEVRDFKELNPFYQQGTQFLSALFAFMATIMAVIVLFTVVNTMSMTVMERTHEIGTNRAMGVRRSDVRWQFVLEGSMLGGLGATLGLLLAQLVGWGVNLLHISIALPGSAQSSQLKLLTNLEVAPLMVAVWVVLLLAAIVAALIPANKAASLRVVDALRHT